MSLTGKTVLVTGGTGSFGQKFIEIAIKQNPKSLRIMSRGEALQVELLHKFPNLNLRFFIGDVRDKERLSRAMIGADIVVHAAALKQIPICEYSPFEAVKTNVMGSMNVVDAAIENKVGKVIGISSDKACHPANLYGATKLVMEKLLIQANVYSQTTRFACTRYGNVVGSRGSVIPMFLQQGRQGTITITDERMTRFWITLEQGVNFVIDCIDRMQGGEVFVPKIKSMKITDLASMIAPQASKVVTGIRAGEKLAEVLITEDESSRALEFDTHYVIEPAFAFWTSRLEGGTRLPAGFVYSSDTNSQWITEDELNGMIRQSDTSNKHVEMIRVLEERVNKLKASKSDGGV